MFPYKEKLYRIESVDNREGKLIASHMDGSNRFPLVKNRECETFSVNNVLEGLLW